MGLVELDVLTLELTHLLDLIEVNDEALLVCMIYLDAFATKDSAMVGTVEVHYPLVMGLAELVLKPSGVGLLIEIDVTEEVVPLHDFV